MSATRIQLRRGIASQWTASSTVVLAAGEIGFETDTNNFKIGDGTKTWAQLPYFKNVDELNSLTTNNLSNYARTSQLSSYLLANRLGVANGAASLDSQGRVPIGQLANIVDGAPELLNTLDELAAALNDNPDVIDNILSALDGKVSDAGDTIKGDLVVQSKDAPETGGGAITANTLRLLSQGQANLVNVGATHALQIGADNQTKLKIDQNEIQAMDSTTGANPLLLNPYGGTVAFGAGVSINGNLELTGTARTISTGTAGNSGSISVGSGGITTTGKISSIQPIQDKSADYQLLSSDKFTMIRSTGTANINIAILSNALAKGERIDFVQAGSGVITFQPAVGVLLRSNGNKFRTNGPWAAVSLVKIEDTTNEFLLIGNLVA